MLSARARGKKSIGATIRIGREILCLPYAGFLWSAQAVTYFIDTQICFFLIFNFFFKYLLKVFKSYKMVFKMPNSQRPLKLQCSPLLCFTYVSSPDQAPSSCWLGLCSAGTKQSNTTSSLFLYVFLFCPLCQARKCDNLAALKCIKVSFYFVSKLFNFIEIHNKTTESHSGLRWLL